MMKWAFMASSGTGLLVFSDNVTEDRSSRINSEVYRTYSLSSSSQMQQSWLDPANQKLQVEITSGNYWGSCGLVDRALDL